MFLSFSHLFVTIHIIILLGLLGCCNCWVDGGMSLEESTVGSAWKSVESSGIVSLRNVGRQQQSSQMVLMSDGSSQLMVYCSNWVLLASNFDVSISFIWRILVKKCFERVLLKFIIGGILFIRWTVGNKNFFLVGYVLYWINF